MHSQILWTLILWIAVESTAGIVLGAPLATADGGADRLRIEVVGDWGTGPRENVQKVLQSVADQLLRFCAGRRLGPIIIRRHEGQPMTLYDKGPRGEYQVLLNSRDTYWGQYAYQFSHELGHVLCNYDRRKEGRNLWLEEAVCETASLFALRKMAVAWKTDPPYPNWASFAPHLDQYVDALLAARDRRLPPDRTMPQWFQEHADALGGQRHPTKDSRLTAAYLLVLFEDEPTGWESLAWINLGPKDGEIDFRAFLQGWKERTPERQRGFIEKIQRLFGLHSRE